MKSIFIDKNLRPSEIDLAKGLGSTFQIWKHIEELVENKNGNTISEWNFSSEKFGWSYRLKDKKRVLVYLLPRDLYFKAAFVFGEKALTQIFESDISENIKSELRNAKKYAEGKGIRIDIRDFSAIKDIEKLIQIKTAN